MTCASCGQPLDIRNGGYESADGKRWHYECFGRERK